MVLPSRWLYAAIETVQAGQCDGEGAVSRSGNSKGPRTGGYAKISQPSTTLRHHHNISEETVGPATGVRLGTKPHVYGLACKTGNIVDLHLRKIPRTPSRAVDNRHRDESIGQRPDSIACNSNRG